MTPYSDYNDEKQYACKIFKETNLSFFLTGKAGTGKSTFLKYLVENKDKNMIVVAPTGIAAINVGGVTIHSFFQFPLRPLLPEDEGIKIFQKDSEKRKLITSMDTLFIDEISMVRADLIDGVDYSLRKNGGDPNLPFGGKQVIFIGDIFQLEPVTIKNTDELNIIKEIYGSSYFYNAKVFEKVKLITIELKKVYRQKETEFIKLLDKVRINEITQSDIDIINSRVSPISDIYNKEFAITLTTKNDSADIVNNFKLSELNSTPFTYNAEITDEFEEHKYPTDAKLILKEGAQVIFIKNDNEKRWINGTIGQVYELTDSTIRIKLKDGTIHSVEKREWENIKYQYNKEKKKIEQDIKGTFRQYPLKLAWAITIHKSQGLTFERVVIDFGNGTFASGQAYVALSRVTTFEGLYLKRKMQVSDIIIDKEIIEFSKTFNDSDLINENLTIDNQLQKSDKAKIETFNILEIISVEEFKKLYNVDELELIKNPKNNGLFVTANKIPVAKVALNYNKDNNEKIFAKLKINNEFIIWALDNLNNKIEYLDFLKKSKIGFNNDGCLKLDSHLNTKFKINTDPKLEIGQEYEGGIIYFIKYDEKHGLISENNENIQLNWYTAKEKCLSIPAGNTNSWYLATKNDLIIIYNNLKLKGFLDFKETIYWSSDVTENNGVWCLNFKDGQKIIVYDKKQQNGVIAVRKF